MSTHIYYILNIYPRESIFSTDIVKAMVGLMGFYIQEFVCAVLIDSLINSISWCSFPFISIYS